MSVKALTCVHCRSSLHETGRTGPGAGGRYRWERSDTPDTAILGSGSECPANERGHEPAREPVSPGAGDGLAAAVRERLLFLDEPLTPHRVALAMRDHCGHAHSDGTVLAVYETLRRAQQ